MLLEFCFALSCLLCFWHLRAVRSPQPNSRTAFIVRNQVTHWRALPKESRHSFLYTTHTLLLSLAELETRSLDLASGWIFRYGPARFPSLTAILPANFLHDATQFKNLSLREKLGEVLRAQGVDDSAIDGVWMMTMPNYLGREGFNPLTVYFCYTSKGDLHAIALEVHNTFVERHVYVLQVGRDEHPLPVQGFTHTWTIAREFHVSPFNDRTGYYEFSTVPPNISPSSAEAKRGVGLPRIRLRFLTARGAKEVKLTAAMRATHATPLTTRSMIITIIHFPLGWLLTSARITYHAFIMHYVKRLDIYAHPDPRAPDPSVEAALPDARNAVQGREAVTGGIGWQPESWTDRWAQRRVIAFLTRRTEELDLAVELVSANPFTPKLRLGPSAPVAGTLTLTYRSPRFFSILLEAPSPAHALQVGSAAERIFRASSDTLFTLVFSAAPPHEAGLFAATARRFRVLSVPSHVMLSIPPHHALDGPPSLMLVVVLAILFLVARAEKFAFRAFRTRFVRGDEPWGPWRKLDRGIATGNRLGSVREGEDD